MATDRSSDSFGLRSGLGNTGLLILRLALGWIFIYHGSQKLFGAFGGEGMFDKLTEGLSHMNMPLLPARAWAWMAACGEFFGGTFVLVGLLSRLATIPIIVTMLVAVGKVHGPNGFSMANGGFEYNFALIGMSLAVMLAGPGKISLDALFFGGCCRSKSDQDAT